MPHRRFARAAAGFTVVLAGSVLAGCLEQHSVRRETISADGGNATAANIALQMVDPWPESAWDRTIRHDGTRMENAIDAYREPPPPPQQPLSGVLIKNGLTTD